MQYLKKLLKEKIKILHLLPNYFYYEKKNDIKAKNALW